MSVYGTDYPTPDGLCIRDYIHVKDLAEAHVLALEALEQGSPKAAYNLGTGRSYSVLEVIKAAEKVMGKKVPYRISPWRLGDQAVLVAALRKPWLNNKIGPGTRPWRTSSPSPGSGIARSL